jgi:hypothetical protein
MTRLYTDGAESGDTLRLNISYTTASTAAKRTGSYSYRTDNITPSVKVLPSTASELYIRVAGLVPTNDTGDRGERQPIIWRAADNTQLGAIRIINGLSSIKAYVGGTVVATATGCSILANEWHVYEVHILCSTNPAVGKIQIKFDGTLVLDFTGNTGTAGVTIAQFAFTTGYGGSGAEDDIAVNDTVGAVDNSWCGDGGVLAALVPMTGAATYSDLIASTGNAWACVDEIPANSTDYVYESTVNKKSTYIMVDLVGLPSGASIPRVWVELDALETSAAGDKIATFLRSGATDAQGADQSLTIAYARYISAEYLTDPQDAAAWTLAKVNALEAGAIVR